ncbi:Uncharacterized protein SCG7086_BE_00120 [Chlamydiales bacterium SCGC AG-110-P3]|nr:Uncharacterized protein SCG7086_BE_00120 [Chlamydiales bacterium SCGC AG-110-P3]
MTEQIKTSPPRKFDTKEFELPETVFVRDIENRVFQAIVLQCLAKVEGIGLVEGNFLDNILGRSATENVKGIFAEQDSTDQTVAIRVEVNIRYGIPIPQKAEEIQSRISEEVTKLTGLHISRVHVVFKSILHNDSTKQLMSQKDASLSPPIASESALEDEFTDEF